MLTSDCSPPTKTSQLILLIVEAMIQLHVVGKLVGILQKSSDCWTKTAFAIFKNTLCEFAFQLVVEHIVAAQLPNSRPTILLVLLECATWNAIQPSAVVRTGSSLINTASIAACRASAVYVWRYWGCILHSLLVLWLGLRRISNAFRFWLALLLCRLVLPSQLHLVDRKLLDVFRNCSHLGNRTSSRDFCTFSVRFLGFWLLGIRFGFRSLFIHSSLLLGVAT